MERAPSWRCRAGLSVRPYMGAADLQSDIEAEMHSCVQWRHTASVANTNQERRQNISILTASQWRYYMFRTAVLTQPEPQQWCLSLLTFQLFQDGHHHRCCGGRTTTTQRHSSRGTTPQPRKIAKSRRRSPDRPAAPLLPSRTTQRTAA